MMLRFFIIHEDDLAVTNGPYVLEFHNISFYNILMQVCHGCPCGRTDTYVDIVAAAFSSPSVGIPVSVCADPASPDTTANGGGSHEKQFSLPRDAIIQFGATVTREQTVLPNEANFASGSCGA